MAAVAVKAPRLDGHCFCCGPDNQHGLKLRFEYPRPGTAVTEFEIPHHFTGWQKVVHGGLLAMVLDESMAHACIADGQNSFTAELTVRYRAPVTVGTRLSAEASVVARRGRLIHAEGHLRTPDGAVVAEATGRFFRPGDGATQKTERSQGD